MTLGFETFLPFLQGFHWRRGWESNPRMKVLQTSPLPLGYRASENSIAKVRWRFDFVGEFLCAL